MTSRRDPSLMFGIDSITSWHRASASRPIPGRKWRQANDIIAAHPNSPCPIRSAPIRRMRSHRANVTQRSNSCCSSGLDHYFDGEYDQAINVWTRALFLDRGHARARAYIERARSALAEQQRESEELLQRGLAAFDRGASAEARRLLEAAIMRGASA